MKYDILIEKLSQSGTVGVLTGAGISAESGIATFRDPDGLWAKFNPAELASMDGFLRNPELVWDWYNYRRKIIAESEPNAGHYALATLERLLPHTTIITQNVDRLHASSGSKNILELHGNIIENHCVQCKKPHTDHIDFEEKSPPKCSYCSSKIRPSVVWFGENLPKGIFEQADMIARQSDVFFSIGTSAEVYPAAYLPQTAKQHGAFLVEINPTRTSLTPFADFHIPAKSGDVLPEIVELLEKKIR